VILTGYFSNLGSDQIYFLMLSVKIIRNETAIFGRKKVKNSEAKKPINITSI
jgi:hypothetical protein